MRLSYDLKRRRRFIELLSFVAHVKFVILKGMTPINVVHTG